MERCRPYLACTATDSSPSFRLPDLNVSLWDRSPNGPKARNVGAWLSPPWLSGVLTSLHWGAETGAGAHTLDPRCLVSPTPTTGVLTGPHSGYRNCLYRQSTLGWAGLRGQTRATPEVENKGFWAPSCWGVGECRLKCEGCNVNLSGPQRA